MVINPGASLHFLRTAFEAGDWIALFLKSYETGHTMQRVGPLACFLEPRIHAWLRAVNAHGYNCYVGVNALARGVRARTRHAVSDVRHVFIETDTDGAALLEAITRRPDLPPPSYVIESSPNRLHMLWRATGFSVEAVERLQKYLARELNTDTAATSCAQTTRLPGYRNHKRKPSSLVSIRYGVNEMRYGPDAFPEPPPMPRVSPRPLRVVDQVAPNRLERARRYLAHVPPAIAGQHGDVHTFRVCCRIARGFALDDDEALDVLTEWNARCVPPWSERDLRAKILHARQYGKELVGALACRADH